MKIHHIGIACNNIQKSLRGYENLGFIVTKQLISDYSRNLDYIFIKNDDCLLELISKTNRSQKSDIDKFLQSSKTGSDLIYHICYECNNIYEKIDQLKAKDYKLLKQPLIAPACDNRLVAFLFHTDCGIVELIQ
jgi:methylmalonyl-CoA/ethylmalonyl-CoA epimerase